MSCRRHILTVLIAAICLYTSGLAYCADSAVAPVTTSGLGDRISPTSIGKLNGDTTALITESYPLGSGDVLSIRVEGRSATNYKVRSENTTDQTPDTVVVSPSGDIFLPLVGTLSVAGKTVAEVQTAVKAGLEKYLKHFQVNVALSTARPLGVWVGGEVQNSGPRELPAMSMASIGALSAGIQSTGTMRRIEIIRNGEKHYLDLYRMTVLGETDSDISLLSGDTIYVPAVKSYVDVRGEAIRPGRFEMVSISGKSKDFQVRDLLQLAIGTTPSAALSKAFIERIGPDGKQISINVDLSKLSDSRGTDMAMQPGDVLVIPSISLFQPIIRLIGEFKGDGVYQRAVASTPTGGSVDVGTVIYNKSGIYYLKQGQTVYDIITATGGITPQADLKQARIERKENGQLRTIPVNLERLLIQGDKSADVAVVNGDDLVLPARADKVHVFGEITKPGSYGYSPNRRLIDYVGDAGGPTLRAKLSDVRIVRGTAESPILIRADAKSAIRGKGTEGNPVLEPGDIVFIPSKFVSDWRDAIQIIFTSLSLRSVLR